MYICEEIMKKILIVEDEFKLLKYAFLAQKSYEIIEKSSGI